MLTHLLSRSRQRQHPGRLNIRDDLPFRVIVDVAHNGDGFRRIGEFVTATAPAGERILLFSVNGDRASKDIIAHGAAAAGLFDRYYIRDNVELRGRPPGDSPRLLAEGLRSAGVPADRIEILENGDTAPVDVLARAREGDSVVMTSCQAGIAPTWEAVASWVG